MEKFDYIKPLPPLDDDGLHIWRVHVPAQGSRLDALAALLSEKELAKADRFRRASDRASSIMARGALRLLLSGYTGIPASELAFTYSETGKPHLAVPLGACDALSFNVSHSGDWVMLAIGRNRQVGIDVEKVRRKRDVQSIASRYFTPEEAARINRAADPHALFVHHWVRKEAYVKALGSALFRELSTFAVPNEDGEKDGWFFRRLDAAPDYAAAVVSDQPLLDVLNDDFATLF